MINPESIPNIDLYIDQVMTLLEEKMGESKRYVEDKLLTKTMVNNYTKNKVLMPAVKKKYTRDHVFLLILICELKPILALEDIKVIFDILRESGEIAGVYTALYHLEQEEDIEKLPFAEQLKDMIRIIFIARKANDLKHLAEKMLDSHQMGEKI